MTGATGPFVSDVRTVRLYEAYCSCGWAERFDGLDAADQASIDHEAAHGTPDGAA